MKRWLLTGLLVSTSIFCPQAKAFETDQYMTWETELEDSSDEINDYLNNKAIPEFLKKINKKKRKIKNPEQLVIKLYLDLFQGLHASTFRKFLKTSEEIDRFPKNKEEYKKESIYESNRPFPWMFLPMAQTIRVGDVYLGIDKFGHFFGFGRRYFQRYNRLVEQGVERGEAIKRAINFGIHNEKGMVGRLVDGIFSYADLEANYHGLKMAIDISSKGYFKLDGRNWEVLKEVDISQYVTPNFDESYNVSFYTGQRRRVVLPRLQELYYGKQDGEIVRQRFEKYDRVPKSFNHNYVNSRESRKRETKRRQQKLENLCEE